MKIRSSQPRIHVLAMHLRRADRLRIGRPYPSPHPTSRTVLPCTNRVAKSYQPAWVGALPVDTLSSPHVVAFFVRSIMGVNCLDSDNHTNINSDEHDSNDLL